jgi:hypothetical protein
VSLGQLTSQGRDLRLSLGQCTSQLVPERGGLRFSLRKPLVETGDLILAGVQVSPFLFLSGDLATERNKVQLPKRYFPALFQRLVHRSFSLKIWLIRV